MKLNPIFSDNAVFAANRPISVFGSGKGYATIKFNGATVKAPDVRAGAALILAGLAAKGITTVTNIELVERGYDHIIEKLRSLGANIKREKI